MKTTKAHFCKDMKRNYFILHSKESMSKEIEDRLVIYIPHFQEYGLPIYDGGSSYVLIKYCPWCGAKLPKSRRNKWLSKMSELGYTSPFSQNIPEVYLLADWEKYLPKKSSNKKGINRTNSSSATRCSTHKSASSTSV